MKKIILYGATIMLVLTTACKKMEFSLGTISLPATTVPGTFTTSFYNTALEFIKLPPNRYFIYKDSATGSTDSVVVTKSIVETKFNPPTSGYPGTPATYYDTYTLTLTKFQVQPPTNQVWFSGIAVSDLTSYTNTNVIDSNFSFSNEQTNLHAFWFPFTSYVIWQYTLFPTLTIEGSTYTEVHKFFTTNGWQPGDANYLGTIHYWVKGIGIIKKEIITSNSVKTSLLVRYG